MDRTCKYGTLETRGRLVRIFLVSVFALTFIFAFDRDAFARQDINVELPEQFEITKVAGNDLIPDSFCLTVDRAGLPVVAGPGYVRRLIDSDDDGVFDEAIELLDGKIDGAQGLCFVGDQLLCTANGGLNLCSPAVGENPATIKRLFEITTGGEHTAHAIRIGPDGWIYVLAGNQTEILPLYYSGPNSPVKEPQAGFLMRFKLVDETCQQFEVVCHGFRNAYDFDFGPDGSIFVYDSDGERDISLPWYRPTRVYRMRAGDNAGWVSASWKRPSYYFDMPETVAKLGRGSPTGVVMNRFHCEIGPNFGRRVFVGDWTFGRIAVVSAIKPIDELQVKQELLESVVEVPKPNTAFATAKGQFGFAVTDLEFEDAYNLFVTVGGRGTEGALYRIRDMPPLKSSVPYKLLEVQRAKSLRSHKSEAFSEKVIGEIPKALSTRNLNIRVAALESLIGRETFLKNVANSTKQAFADSLRELACEEKLNPTLIRLTRRVLSQLSKSDRDMVLTDVPVSRQLLLSFSVSPQGSADAERAARLGDLIDASDVGIEKTVFIRAAQLVLGGCEGEGMFAGYSAKNPLAEHITTDSFESLNLDSDDTDLRNEIGRLAAMLSYDSSTFRKQLVQQLTDDSHPVEDIHWLNCIAKTRGEIGAESVTRIANSLSRIRGKLRERELPTDRNWIPRMQELTKDLYGIPGVAIALVNGENFGRSDHAFLFAGLEGDAKEVALEKFAEIASKEPESVSQSLLQIVASNPANKPVLRKCKNNDSLFDVVVSGLSVDADVIDRPVFSQGLSSWNMSTVKKSAIALRRIGKPQPDQLDETKTEFRNAMQTAMRIGFDNQAVSVRDQIMLYLRSATGREFGYLERQQKPNPQLQATQLKSLQQWRKFLAEKFDVEIATPGDSSKLLSRLETIDFSTGDAERGRAVFVKRQCATCHDSDRGTKLGPPLSGIVNRFSKQSVFEAIVSPDAQVPDRYRAILIVTEDGVLHTGTVIYESVDGITLMDVSGKTIRINKRDIEQRKRLNRSLMPSGLFDGITDEGVADVWSYILTIK